MCGIFGFCASSPDSLPDLDTIKLIGSYASRRGPDAWGIAALSSGSTLLHKSSRALTEELHGLNLLAPYSAFIGHARLATSGTLQASSLRDAQPTTAGEYSLVHNGNVPNYRALQVRHELRPLTDCDSETLVMMAAHSKLPRHQAWASALGNLRPSPYAILALTPDGLLASHYGLPLFHAVRAEGTYFCSLPAASDFEALPESALHEFRAEAIAPPPTALLSRQPAPPETEPPRVASWQHL